jgi:hypothetical protein
MPPMERGIQHFNQGRRVRNTFTNVVAGRFCRKWLVRISVLRSSCWLWCLLSGIVERRADDHELLDDLVRDVHMLLSIRRDRDENQVDDAHCNDEESVRARLEELIEEITMPREWVGR